jgi:hypothetical protein
VAVVLVELTNKTSSLLLLWISIFMDILYVFQLMSCILLVSFLDDAVFVDTLDQVIIFLKKKI